MASGPKISPGIQPSKQSKPRQKHFKVHPNVNLCLAPSRRLGPFKRRRFGHIRLCPRISNWRTAFIYIHGSLACQETSLYDIREQDLPQFQEWSGVEAAFSSISNLPAGDKCTTPPRHLLAPLPELVRTSIRLECPWAF